MKYYQCKKIVQAGRIIIVDDNGTLYLDENNKVTPSEGWHNRVAQMLIESNCHITDGYYVLYKDGFESWSPSDVFEEGYTELEPETQKDYRVWPD